MCRRFGKTVPPESWLGKKLSMFLSSFAPRAAAKQRRAHFGAVRRRGADDSRWRAADAGLRDADARADRSQPGRAETHGRRRNRLAERLPRSRAQNSGAAGRPVNAWLAGQGDAPPRQGQSRAMIWDLPLLRLRGLTGLSEPQETLDQRRPTARLHDDLNQTGTAILHRAFELGRKFFN